MPRRPNRTNRRGSSNEDFEDTLDRIYDDGFEDGYYAAKNSRTSSRRMYGNAPAARSPPDRKKRKLSGWNKFVRTNSKKKEFRFASGKVNLKKLGVAYRKSKRSGRR
jgi:hypothetical protein